MQMNPFRLLHDLQLAVSDFVATVENNIKTFLSYIQILTIKSKLMKNKFRITALFFLLASFGFAQSSQQVAVLPQKNTSPQTKTTQSGSTGDVAKGEAVTVTEGKKGLNAVNVKRSKQSETRANTLTAGSLELDPLTGTASETKHAINTKGTGATRDGAGKDK